MISIREAVRLKKRVRELETVINNQRARWGREYPGGVHIGTITLEKSVLLGRIEAVRLLQHAVVITESGDGKLQIYALPQATT